jgi:IMP dehydrogenase
MGSLRTSMATCGYQDLAEFNRAEVMVAPALMTEGKMLQSTQGVGMGSRGAAVSAHTPDSPANGVDVTAEVGKSPALTGAE